MNKREYFPSAQFSLLVASIALSLTLVYAADLVTQSGAGSGGSTDDSELSVRMSSSDSRWQETLDEIQAKQADILLPPPPDQNTLEGLRQAAKSSNVTDSIARTLLVDLTNAKAQGLGGDIPTQNQLIASALSQIKQTPQTKAFVLNDLTVVTNSPASLRAFGNSVMSVLARHPGASMAQTFIVIGYAVDNTNQSALSKLRPIADAYRALTLDLAKVPVPQTLSPLYLALVNNYAAVTDSYADMEVMLTDPVRGLYGIERYQSQSDGAKRMFTNIARALSKDGILFNKDELGATWSVFLSAQ